MTGVTVVGKPTSKMPNFRDFYPFFSSVQLSRSQSWVAADFYRHLVMDQGGDSRGKKTRKVFPACRYTFSERNTAVAGRCTQCGHRLHRSLPKSLWSLDLLPIHFSNVQQVRMLSSDSHTLTTSRLRTKLSIMVSASAFNPIQVLSR